MVRIEDLEEHILEDEYDMEEMERLEREAPDSAEWSAPTTNDWCYHRDNPAFRDTSDMYRYVPIPEYMGPPESQMIDYNSLYVGRIFNNKEEAKMAARTWSIENGVEYRTDRSTIKSLHLVCKKTPQFKCPWELRVLQRSKTTYWVIKEVGSEHTCNRTSMLRDNFHLNRHVIAKHYEGILKATLRLDARKLVEDVEKDFGLKITYLKAWMAKQTAMDNAFGNWDESFGDLPQLFNVLQQSNPGTFVKWDTTTMADGTNEINRVFWSFAPMIEGFNHCRPVLSIDGTHLYGKYKGQLLTAIAQDADNQVLPLAFALVESENNSSWKWFMRCMREGVTNREGLCVVSDRNVGLMATMNSLREWMPPFGIHRYCIRHVCSNFNTKVKNLDLKDELMRIAYFTNKNHFDERLHNLLSALSQEQRAWLLEIPREKWALSYDGGHRWGAMTSNAAECYNKCLKGCRDLPISAMVRFTFVHSNQWCVERREMYLNTPHPFPETVLKGMQTQIAKCRVYKTRLFDRQDMVCQVQDGGVHNVYEVRMNDQTCTCGFFQAYHYPCSHAMAVIKEHRLDIPAYMSYYHTIQAHHSTWAPQYNPIPAEREWPVYNGPRHLPNPRYNNPSKGKYKSTRIPNEMDWSQSQQNESQLNQSQENYGGTFESAPYEGGGPSGSVNPDEASGSTTTRRVQKCKKCGGRGHNSRSCHLSSS